MIPRRSALLTYTLKAAIPTRTGNGAAGAFERPVLSVLKLISVFAIPFSVFLMPQLISMGFYFIFFNLNK